MTAPIRRVVFLLFGAGLLGLLIAGVLGLSPFGHYPGPYGDILNAVAVRERHVLNVVTAVIFDYRGFDTLGEEFILFACVTAVTLLLRHEENPPRENHSSAPSPQSSRAGGEARAEVTEAARLFGAVFIGLLLVFGIYIVITGHLSLGGGFQGGLILASAWLLLFLAYGSERLHQFSNQYVVEWFESSGAAAYVLVGLAGLAVGRSFLANILPLGQAGQLLSSGTILLINCAVGVEVAAGFILLLDEFAKSLEHAPPKQ